MRWVGLKNATLFTALSLLSEKKYEQILWMVEI